jgi:hypothetical protein
MRTGNNWKGELRPNETGQTATISIARRGQDETLWLDTNQHQRHSGNPAAVSNDIVELTLFPQAVLGFLFKKDRLVLAVFRLKPWRG